MRHYRTYENLKDQRIADEDLSSLFIIYQGKTNTTCHDK